MIWVGILFEESPGRGNLLRALVERMVLQSPNWLHREQKLKPMLPLLANGRIFSGDAGKCIGNGFET